jgi:hypothetical protein
MTTNIFNSPKELVENYIIQASEVFDKHSPRISELIQLEFKDFNSNFKKKNGNYVNIQDNKEKEKRDAIRKELIRTYRNELRKVCEQFGIKLTKYNFSDTGFGPLPYAYHRVRKIETISPTKIKIFTRVPRKKKGTCVFYLDLVKEKWTITKYRYIDWEGKEAATEW